MERSTRDKLAERIVSAGGPVVLLGPAASGKTAAALAVYARFQRDGRSACLLLLPNARAAAALRRRLLAGSTSGVIVAPKVMTFAALAARILAAAGDRGRVLSPFSRHLLLAKVIDELVAAGELPALSAVADTPGLVVTLDRAIAELKRAAVEPAELQKAIARGDEKARELLAVYARYQEHLLAAGAYDVEGQMWQARDCLARAEARAGLDDIEALAADGFTDFTPTQLEMLALLAKRGKRVLITLPYAQDGRARLWHWTQRTLGNVRRAFGAKLEEMALGRDDGGAGLSEGNRAPEGHGSLAALWDRVFDFDAGACELPQGLAVIAAPGIDAEVAGVARRIKRLLVEASAARIAVLARSMDAYREPIDRIFAEHDIPLSPAAQPLTDVPVVRFVLNVASLAPRLTCRDVLRAITSSYFRPDALGDFDEQTVAAAEMLIREGNVLAGREAYAKAARRLARRTTQAAEDEDEQTVALGALAFTPQAILKAGEMLGRLFDLSERRASAEAILAIIDALQLRRAAAEHDEPALAARDLRALAALEAALAELDGQAVPPARLREALSAVTCPPASLEAMVDVMDVLDARSLRYGHVFLLGLGEGQFPYRFLDSPLVGEADRLAWAKRGVVLDNRGDLTAREMLLFYLAASRADASLTLSYMETDASGKPGAASSFTESFFAPAGGLASPAVKQITEKLQRGRFIPPAGELCSRRDVLNAALAALFGGEDADSASALAWVAGSDPVVIERASSGLWAQSRRNSRGPCDEFDGRVTEPELLKKLSSRFGPDAAFSATQLNAYGQCPWQFFATFVLHLAALREPQRRLEPIARGVFCHDVLLGVMSSLSAESGGPVRLHEVDEPRLLESLAGAVQAASAAVEDRQTPYPALWRLQRQQMHAQLRDYLLAARLRSQLSNESMHFELGFGLEAGEAGRQHADAASRDEPVTIATGAGPVKIRGKIDRVDRVSFEGRQGLMVIDYKTGLAPTKADIEAGRSLQLPLYAAAVEQILGQESLGGAFHRIGDTRGKYERLFAAVKSHGDRYITNGEYQEKLRSAMSNVGKFVSDIRGGRFDLLPTHDCPPYCPFRQICQYSEYRSELKAAGREDEQ